MYHIYYVIIVLFFIMYLYNYFQFPHYKNIYVNIKKEEEKKKNNKGA